MLLLNAGNNGVTTYDTCLNITETKGTNQPFPYLKGKQAVALSTWSVSSKIHDARHLGVSEGPLMGRSCLFVCLSQEAGNPHYQDH